MSAVEICAHPDVESQSAGQVRRDPLWNAIQAEALDTAERDPVLRPMLDRVVLSHRTLGCALVHRLAELLTEPDDDPALLRRVFAEVVATSPEIRQAAKHDLLIIRRRDPATTSNLTPFLNFKGYQALQAGRIAHALWHSDRKPLALYLQGRIAAVYGVDIHPAAAIGRGVFIDHATGVVVGETASVGNNVVMLHGVTLGATGKDRGDRHPKVEDDVFIGAGAKILGNIRIGRGATVGAGSIVLRNVPPGTTVAGVPARVVRGRAAIDSLPTQPVGGPATHPD